MPHKFFSSTVKTQLKLFYFLENFLFFNFRNSGRSSTWFQGKKVQNSTGFESSYSRHYFSLLAQAKKERKDRKKMKRSRQSKDRVGENRKGKERHNINEADIDGSESNILEEDMMLS